MEIYQRVVENGFSSNFVVSAFVDMHAKYGRMQKAHKLFNKMHGVNIIS